MASINQERVIRLLQNGMKRDRISHAYCFSGPKGSGKEKTARFLAQLLNCERQQETPCQTCRSCRQIQHGNHPDIRWLDPEGASIKINQMRQLQQQFSYSASAGVTRMVIIRQADKMTTEAANSLLKFLEEPTTNMVALLLTDRQHALLPTIRSRCQLLQFSPLPPDQIAQQLIDEGKDPALARIAAHVTGELDQVRALLGRETFALICDRVIKWGEEIASGRSHALVTVQIHLLADEEWADQLGVILDLLLWWLRDILNHQLQREEQAVFTSKSDSRRRQASLWSRSDLIQAIKCVVQAREELSGNVQPQAVLERMVLAMQGGVRHAGSGWSPLSTSG